MLDGFIRVAAASPKVKVSDVEYNVSQTIEFAKKASANDAAVIVFPELGLTGYTCCDLFGQNALLDKAIDGLYDLAEQTSELNTVIIVGLPVQVGGKLKTTVTVATDCSDEDIVKAACADEKIQRLMQGMELVKTIVVKGRLVNLILKPQK